MNLHLLSQCTDQDVNETLGYERDEMLDFLSEMRQSPPLNFLR